MAYGEFLTRPNTLGNFRIALTISVGRACTLTGDPYSDKVRLKSDERHSDKWR